MVEILKQEVADFFGMGSSDGSGKVKYVCLVCNNKHKGGTCPRCGSKMQRADF